MTVCRRAHFAVHLNARVQTDMHCTGCYTEVFARTAICGGDGSHVMMPGTPLPGVLT